MAQQRHMPIDDYKIGPDGQLILASSTCIACGVPWSDCPVRIGAHRAATTRGTS